MARAAKPSPPIPYKHRDTRCVGVECDICSALDCPENMALIEGVRCCNVCAYRLTHDS